MTNKKEDKPLFCLDLLSYMYDLFAIDVVVETCLALCTKNNLTVFESKEGIILGYSDIVTRQNCSTTLADYDLTNLDVLAMIDLDPQILRI